MSKKIVVLVVIVAVIGMTGAGAAFYLLWSKLAALEASGSGKGGQGAESKVAQPTDPGPIFPLDTFIVNLADPGGKTYLRVTMDLEISDGKFSGELEKRLPQIRDTVLMILPMKQFADIRNVTGKNALRSELMETLNALMKKDVVSNIYFTEFVVQ